jgi:hypothetical protein
MKYKLLKNQIGGLAWHYISPSDPTVVICTGFCDTTLPQYIEHLPDIVEEFTPTGQVGFDEPIDNIEPPYTSELYFKHDILVVRMPCGQLEKLDRPHVVSINRRWVECIDP